MVHNLSIYFNYASKNTTQVSLKCFLHFVVWTNVTNEKKNTGTVELAPVIFAMYLNPDL